MKKTVTSDMFASLELPAKEVPEASVSRYRVYKNATEFTVVSAENAKEALEVSGLKKAHRIEREGIFLYNVMNNLNAPAQPLEETVTQAAEKPPEETPPIAVEAMPQPPELTPPTTEPEAPSALSNDDVNKLLQG